MQRQCETACTGSCNDSEWAAKRVHHKIFSIVGECYNHCHCVLPLLPLGTWFLLHTEHGVESISCDFLRWQWRVHAWSGNNLQERGQGCYTWQFCLLQHTRLSTDPALRGFSLLHPAGARAIKEWRSWHFSGMGRVMCQRGAPQAATSSIHSSSRGKHSQQAPRLNVFAAFACCVNNEFCLRLHHVNSTLKAHGIIARYHGLLLCVETYFGGCLGLPVSARMCSQWECAWC